MPSASSNDPPATWTALLVANFEPLLARLSDRYHLVAPDCPGFGHSDWSFFFMYAFFALVAFIFESLLNV
jgi:pimeloyl-ACP methyl ester carboxylesterase